MCLLVCTSLWIGAAGSTMWKYAAKEPNVSEKARKGGGRGRRAGSGPRHGQPEGVAGRACEQPRRCHAAVFATDV